MRIEPTDNVVFRYSSPLKTLYKKGKLPFVKYGFYGDELTPKNVTIEHLRCVSHGGKTELKNVVLVSANKNQERGTRPLSEMINWEFVGRYFEQFRNVVIGYFDGNKYIEMVTDTIKELLKNEGMV